MKKSLLSLIWFIFAFVAAYLSLCYLVPDLRIKLAAEPFVYLIESLRHMAPLKTAVSFVVGLVAAAISIFANKGK